MKKTNRPSRALSCALACALAFTMTPIAAFADGAPSDSTETAEEPIEAVAEADEPAEVSEQQAPEMHKAEVPVAVAANSGANSASDVQPVQEEAAEAATEAKADLEIIASSVALGDAPATVLVHNGLNYQVNPDDPATVALVGWSTAPTGALTVPTQIPTNNGSLSVTGIMTGGGSLKI